MLYTVYLNMYNKRRYHAVNRSIYARSNALETGTHSDNQIRCMLTAGDLEKRSLKLSELAYGSEKARGLFHELVEQASDELGFDTGGYPLIIEAVPVTSDCIMLLITKANEPEELDTRFARFTESNDGTQDDVPDTESAGADDDLTDIFRQLSDEITQKPKDDDIPGQPPHC